MTSITILPHNAHLKTDASTETRETREGPLFVATIPISEQTIESNRREYEAAQIETFIPTRDGVLLKMAEHAQAYSSHFFVVAHKDLGVALEIRFPQQDNVASLIAAYEPLHDVLADWSLTGLLAYHPA